MIRWDYEQLAEESRVTGASPWAGSPIQPGVGISVGRNAVAFNVVDAGFTAAVVVLAVRWGPSALVTFSNMDVVFKDVVDDVVNEEVDNEDLTFDSTAGQSVRLRYSKADSFHLSASTSSMSSAVSLPCA